MESGSEQLQSVQTEVIELRRNIQTLEIDLQSQLSMVHYTHNRKHEHINDPIHRAAG